MNKKEANNKIQESLSPIERKILPFIKEKDFDKIAQKSNLDKTSVMRALQFLSNKNILKLKQEKKEIIDLGKNGIIYLKAGLPERKLLNLLIENKKPVEIEEAKKIIKLSDNEITVAMGVLKNKRLVTVAGGKIIMFAEMSQAIKKSEEELLLERLPSELNKLNSEQLNAVKNLRKRKEIIEVKNSPIIEIEITDFGKGIIENSSDYKSNEFIETLTPEIIKNEEWKSKKFRRYDITSKVPEIYGAKRHFVNQAVDYARKIWIEMGFEEMDSPLVIESFWNFDALFTAQDHPVRDLQDTFFLNYKGKLPDKKLVDAVKKTHEQGVAGSKGWKYKWNEEEAKKLVLRTHTTACSALALASLKKQDLPKKFFSIGKCFRNETLDWSHGFEFNQTEGIVVDENANFRNLLGYLKEFFRKMGYEKIKFVPSFFPYTEPSVEIYVWNDEKKIWFELGGAGIFRPEVVVPLLGFYVPVLAWGPGFDRTIMSYYDIKDLREMYKNNLEQLRKIKNWMK